MTNTPTSTLPVEATAEGLALLRVDPGPDGDAVAWARAHRDALRAEAFARGALLVRGLGLTDTATAASVLGVLGTDLMGDQEGFAQRLPVADGVWSSAAWPDHQLMCMHHELGHRRVVPRYVLLACPVAPAEGGATALADAAEVLAALPSELVAGFEREGWLLRRCFGGDVGPSLEEAFGSADRAAVDAYCAANDISARWLSDGRLLTQQRRPAVVTHPATGRRCWFNQVAFLSEWTLDPEVREFLVDMDGEEGLPFATAYGNGDPVGPEVVEQVQAAYDAVTVREPWRSGDLLLVDNVASAHNREPFSGPREVVLALSDPWEVPR